MTKHKNNTKKQSKKKRHNRTSKHKMFFQKKKQQINIINTSNKNQTNKWKKTRNRKPRTN